jgi:hypothetical protein
MFNSKKYDIDTTQHANLHQPTVNLMKYQKGVYCLGVQVLNILLSYIKIESDNANNLNWFYRNFYMKIPFIL